MTTADVVMLVAPQRGTAQFCRVVKNEFTPLDDGVLLEILRLGHFWRIVGVPGFSPGNRKLTCGESGLETGRFC
jgi:hypothetical protein